MVAEATVTISRHDFDASIFDLDGVLTDTARIHAAAWKAVFDEFLLERSRQQGTPFQPFDISADYLAYVDGRPRVDGIRSFLGARSIRLPDGSEWDPDGAETVRALGERKQWLFQRELQHGIKPLAGASALLKELRAARIGVAVASSSKNCAAVLHAAGLADLVDVRADGLDVEALRLAGKPNPALFLEAARRLGVPPRRAILFEDALAGVEAGRSGAFACVVGVDRGNQGEALRQRGADFIVQSLCEVRVMKE